MTSPDELACVYAALLLADDNVSITAEKISTVLKAAGVVVEPYWPSLFSKALDGVNVKELISNIGSAAGSAPAAAPAGGAPAAGGEATAEAKKEEKKKEESEESDDDMGFGLFD